MDTSKYLSWADLSKEASGLYYHNNQSKAVRSDHHAALSSYFPSLIFSMKNFPTEPYLQVSLNRTCGDVISVAYCSDSSTVM